MRQAYRVIGDSSGHLYPVGTVVYEYMRYRSILLVTTSPAGINRGGSSRWVEIRDLEPIKPEPQRIPIADILAEVVRIRDERYAEYAAAISSNCAAYRSAEESSTELALSRAHRRYHRAACAVAAVAALDDGADQP